MQSQHSIRAVCWQHSRAHTLSWRTGCRVLRCWCGELTLTTRADCHVRGGRWHGRRVRSSRGHAPVSGSRLTEAAHERVAACRSCVSRRGSCAGLHVGRDVADRHRRLEGPGCGKVTQVGLIGETVCKVIKVDRGEKVVCCGGLDDRLGRTVGVRVSLLVREAEAGIGGGGARGGLIREGWEEGAILDGRRAGAASDPGGACQPSLLPVSVHTLTTKRTWAW